MQKVKAIIFDLDGTLIDTAPLIGEILNTMRIEEGMQALPIHNYRNWISLGASELVDRAMEQGSYDLSSALSEFRRRYREMNTPINSLFSGATWVVDQLCSQGIKLAICSNKPESLCKKVLMDTGLIEYFDIVVGGDTVSKSKPYPEPLEFALINLGIAANSAVFVGDSTVDQNASIAANIPFIFFSKGYNDGVDITKTFTIINDLKRLIEIVIP